MSAHRTLLLVTVLVAAISSPCSMMAQDVDDTVSTDAPSEEMLRVFLDCERYICDFDHFRREVDYVSYVRQREDAQVHVLVTFQRTGAGGGEYTFDFIGLNELQERGDTLQYLSDPNDTDDETRTGVTQTFALGLVPFVARTSSGQHLTIRYEPPDDPEGNGRQLAPANDPWNLWVFRISISGELEGETRERQTTFDGSISANRTTEEFKFTTNIRSDFSDRRITVSEPDEPEEVVTSFTREWDSDATAVWSLSPHWSAGGTGAVTSDTRANQALTVRAGPALEYNIFPYAESTRRQITFLYKVGVASYDYYEITAFNETAEVRPEHSLDISAQFQQPWGEISASLESASFLDDMSQHRIDLSSNLEFRIVRGVSVNMEASVARVKNQIYIPLADLDEDEILLGTQELGTDFEYQVDLGLSFNFGSVFNNVVNPRMRTRGGGRFRGF
jgi:hypothetical protein